MPSDEHLQRLLRAVRAGLRGDPAPLPEEPSPLPWEGWLVVCLLRQRARQRWLARMVKERLQREDLEEEGPVPGYAGWRYDSRERGFCLTGPDETLDVDTLEDEGAFINPSLFTYRLLTLGAPGLPETRLVALLPSASLIDTALQGLQTRGLIELPWVELPHGTHVFRLTPELEALVEPAVGLEAGREDALERCLAHLGDFEALEPLPGTEDSRARGEAARRLRRDWLLPLAAAPETSEDALHALEPLLTPEERVRLCEQILGGAALSGAMACAVEQLDAMPDAPGHEAVLGVLARLSPEEDLPHLAQAVAHYLLRRGIEREGAIASLLAFARVGPATRSPGNPFTERFALLALEYAHEHAREMVRLTLRASGLRCRMVMAAALCLLDRPWCQRELLLALRECDRRSDANVFALALEQSTSEWARAAVNRWRRELASEEEFGQTWAETEEQRRGIFDWAKDHIRPWVESTRARLPADDSF